MTYSLITRWDSNGRCVKCAAGFATEADAAVYLNDTPFRDGTLIDFFPDAIVVETPDAPVDHWHVDPETKAFTTPGPVVTAQDIKAHTSARIQAVIGGEVEQRNLTAYGATLAYKQQVGTATDEEETVLAVIAAANDWVRATLAVGRALRDPIDPTFADDSHWPAPPAGIAAIIAAL